MCKNDIRHQFNVYTSKKTVFVCFAIFKYQLQLSVISGECVEDFCQYHILFFSPLCLVFIRKKLLVIERLLVKSCVFV